MDAWTSFLTSIVYPTIALSIPALLGVGIAFVNKHLGLQTTAALDTSARSAVQGAVSTFAGKVLGDVASGKVSIESVRSGAAGKAMLDYAAGTVNDSMTQLGVTPATLSAMLVGKVETLVSAANAPRFGEPAVVAQQQAAAPS